MQYRIFKRLTAIAMLAALGCARPDADLATIADSRSVPLPPGYEPAWIVEIGGRRVPPERSVHHLKPGAWRLGLRPVVEGPPDQVPLTAGANRDGEVLYLDLEIEAGRRYELGLRAGLAGDPVPAVIRVTRRR